jgi:hypothetical protein
MISQRVWVLVGIILGAGTGVLAAYVAWRGSRKRASKRFMATVAVLTLTLAGVLGVVAFMVDTTWEYRVLLLLTPGFLGYWLVRQIIDIRKSVTP